MDYSGEVQRRFAAPGRIARATEHTGCETTGEAGDRSLGVWVCFHVRARAGQVEAVRFQVFGCPHTIAAVSLLAERLEGEGVAALGRDWARELAADLSVPAEKLGRLLVLEDALRACARHGEQG